MASARFHRPDSGLGLGEKAQANIRSMRRLTDKMDVFTCGPHNDLLSDRKPNEAYCLAKPGRRRLAPELAAPDLPPDTSTEKPRITTSYRFVHPVPI